MELSRCLLNPQLRLQPLVSLMRHCLSSTFANLWVIGFWQCSSQHTHRVLFCVTRVRMERLELSNLAALDPKSSVSTNSTTSACDYYISTQKQQLQQPLQSLQQMPRMQLFHCILLGLVVFLDFPQSIYQQSQLDSNQRPHAYQASALTN